MNFSSILRSIFIVIALLCATLVSCLAQEVTESKRFFPFDSLIIRDVQAVGSLKTGSLTIEMEFENKYSKVANVHLGLGGFENMGASDSKGNKYKIFTSEKLIGTENINKGYKQITAVQFGDKKFDWLTYVKTDVPYNESRRLKVLIPKFTKSESMVTDFHIRCILSLNYMWTGDRIYHLTDIPITWR